MKAKAKCLMISIVDFFKTGVFVRHLFEQTMEEAIIVADNHHFRVSKNYIHAPGEEVYRNAGLIRSKCKYCGKEELSWFPDWNQRYRYE